MPPLKICLLISVWLIFCLILKGNIMLIWKCYYILHPLDSTNIADRKSKYRNSYFYSSTPKLCISSYSKRSQILTWWFRASLNASLSLLKMQIKPNLATVPEAHSERQSCGNFPSSKLCDCTWRLQQQPSRQVSGNAYRVFRVVTMEDSESVKSAGFEGSNSYHS